MVCNKVMFEKTNYKKEVLKRINKLNINSVEVGMCTTIEDEFNIHQFRDILSPEKELVVLTRLNEKEIKKNSQIENS